MKTGGLALVRTKFLSPYKGAERYVSDLFMTLRLHIIFRREFSGAQFRGWPGFRMSTGGVWVYFGQPYTSKRRTPGSE